MSGKWMGCVLGLLFIAGCERNDKSPLETTEHSSQQMANGSQAVAGEEASAQPSPAQAAPANETGADLGKQGGPVELDDLTLAAPEGWIRRAPNSGFVLAEFTLPSAKNDEGDGRLTVSSAGGDIEANIERWRTQFGGNPEKASRRTVQADGVDVTMVDFSGEYNDQRGPFSPATKRSGSRMIAAIIPMQGGLYFVKAVGPEATIAAHSEKLEAFIKSAKKK